MTSRDRRYSPTRRTAVGRQVKSFMMPPANENFAPYHDVSGSSIPFLLEASMHRGGTLSYACVDTVRLRVPVRR